MTLKATYCNPEDVPTKFLVVGWYARTKTSGLTTDIMDGFETMLRNHLKDLKNGSEEIDFTITDDDLADVEVRSYDGDIATIGGNIKFDDDVDIFLGAGVNLGTQGGVTYLQRNAYEIGDTPDRYIYRLNDRPQVKNIYTWMRSTDVRAYFK